MIRHARHVDWTDPSVIGKFVLFETVFTHGVVSSPYLIVSLKGTKQLVVEPYKEGFIAEPDKRIVKGISTVLFVCDSNSEAVLLYEQTKQCREAIERIDKRCVEDTRAMAIANGAKP